VLDVAVFVIRRLIVSFFILLASTFIIFTLVALSGDPLSDLRTDTSPNRDAKIRARTEQLHLEQPIPARYAIWISGVAKCVVPGQQCDLGKNRNGQDVSALLATAVSSTLRLVSAAVVLAIILGVSIGIVSALRQYSGFDYTITMLAFLFFSLPIFWVAVLLKQYLAIAVNDWYADPKLSLFSSVILGALSALTWGAVLGGSSRRRWITRAVAFGGTVVALLAMSASGWFKAPALGPGLIIVLSLGAAVGVTALTSGLNRRNVLYACLATAGVGCIAQFVVTPWIRDPKWASWTNVLALLVVALAVAVGIGWALGGLDREQAIRATVLTAVLTGSVIVLDILLRTVSPYGRLVNGRIFATTGSETPNFTGTFWESQLDTLTHLILPTLAIMVISFAGYSRFSRASMLEVMNMDFVRTARSKGLTERTVVMRHAFRNALIPITTLMAFDFGALLGGAVITETVFSRKGMGSLFVVGLGQTDPNPVMGFYIVTAVSIVLFNMVADIAYAYLDPRIRLS
jgi:peptide/nickel transport system permease protein